MFLAHITHEAVQKFGGIGAVLRGLITSRHYKSIVKRTVLVGPVTDEERKLIEAGKTEITLVPSKQMKDRTAAIGLGQIEQRYGVEFLYGERVFKGGDAGVDNAVEVLLIDASKMPRDQVRTARTWLKNEFGLRFDKFRMREIYDRFVRMAAPAYEALLTLRRSKDGPVILASHEWFGLPLAYWVIGRRDPRYRTILHAHEVAAIRPIVEKHPAHDVAFYNALRLGLGQGKYLPDVFGSIENSFTGALVSRAHLLDRIFAVGDPIVDEFRFLDAEFAKAPIDLVYNGIGAPKIPLEAKIESRKRLQEYARRLVGWRPDFVLTHVARPVPSKAFWRDVQLLAELDPKLAAAGERAVLFILASATPPRSVADVAKMEKDYNWPVEHRKGYPDLAGPETQIERVVRSFNRKAKASHAIFVNQFGWQHGLCGKAMPRAMEFADVRRGTDVELGMSAYEPFGIAQIEPLPFGAICVISGACGCRGFIEKVNTKSELVNVIVKDYAVAPKGATINKLTKMTKSAAGEIEKKVAKELAAELYPLLPRSDKDRKKYLTLGYRYARQMSWDVVVRDFFLPGVKAVVEA
jgi:glycosyltransferase involved in cell wall biosynthesis